jgi:hypothetical protein
LIPITKVSQNHISTKKKEKNAAEAAKAGKSSGG